VTRRRHIPIRRAVENSVLRSPVMTGSMATAVMSQLLLVASGVVVARALGPENRGVLALVFVLSALVTQVGSLGIPVSVTYWIAAEGMSPRVLLRGLRRVRSLQSAAVLAVHAVLIVVVLEPRSPSGFLWVGFLSLAATAAGLSKMYGLAVLQGLRRFGAFNSLRILSPTLYVVGVVGLWAVGRASLTSIALVIICAPVIAAGATWLVVLRRAPPARPPNEVATRRVVSFGLRSLAGSAPPVETFRLDQLLVGLVLAPVALGYYIIAQAFTNLTRFIGQSIGMVTYPRVAAADERSQLRIIRHHVVLGVTVSGGLTLALILAVPSLLPFFFGAEFGPAGTTAQILLVATFFASVRRILVDGTRGSGWPMWGASAELLTLLSLPAAVVVTSYTESLAAVALVLAGANLLGLLAVAPALLGVRHQREVSDDSPLRTAPRSLHPASPTATVALAANRSAVVRPEQAGKAR
jgi:O-antigen/teichoic acid export membrane protein